MANINLYSIGADELTAGTDRYWIGGAAGATTDSNNTDNWSLTDGGAGGAGVPDATCDVYFGAGSTGYNCVLTANFACQSIFFTTDWNKTFNLAGFTLTSEHSIIFDGTAGSVLTLDAAVTINQNGDFTINSGVGTVTVTSCNLLLQGTGSLTVAKININFANMTLAYTGKTTLITYGVANDYQSVGPGNGQLTVNGGTLQFADYGYIGIRNTTQTDPIVIVAGSSIVFGIYSVIYYYINVASTLTLNIPAMTITGTNTQSEIIINHYAGGALTINVNGTLNMVNNIRFGSQQTTTFNTNNNAITCSLFDISSFASTCTFNFGSSAMSIKSFVSLYGHVANTNINLQTSIWSVSTNWTNQALTTLDAGTSAITFNGSASTTITTAGLAFYTVIVDKASNTPTVTLSGNLVCNTLTTNAGTKGNFTASTYTITSAGSITFNSTGTLTLANTVTITGDGDFHIGSAVGAPTLTNCTVELRGTGNFDIDKASLTFVSVKFNADTKVISSTGDAIWTTGRLYVEPGTKVKYKSGVTPVVTTYVAGDCDGTAGKLVEFEAITPGSAFGLTLPATM